MPRPLSWLPRLHEISRSVENSVRSHYDRHDLERLFELQPRAAQKLLDLMPSVKIGTSRLVAREALASFLGHVREAKNTTELFGSLRRKKSGTARKKPRALIRRDLDPIDLTSLPQLIGLTRGRLEMNFGSVEDFVESLYILARALESDLETFAREFEPDQTKPEPEEALEIKELFAELERMEDDWRAARPFETLPSHSKLAS